MSGMPWEIVSKKIDRLFDIIEKNINYTQSYFSLCKDDMTKEHLKQLRSFQNVTERGLNIAAKVLEVK